MNFFSRLYTESLHSTTNSTIHPSFTWSNKKLMDLAQLYPHIAINWLHLGPKPMILGLSIQIQSLFVSLYTHAIKDETKQRKFHSNLYRCTFVSIVRGWFVGSWSLIALNHPPSHKYSLLYPSLRVSTSPPSCRKNHWGPDIGTNYWLWVLETGLKRIYQQIPHRCEHINFQGLNKLSLDFSP